jgi:hypothetical protein
MMTSTVERFTSHLQTLDSVQDIRLSTYDGILREAVRYYTILYTGVNQWLPLSKQPSVFLGNGSSGGNNNNINTPPNELLRGNPSLKRQTHDAKGNPIDCVAPAKVSSTVRDSKTMTVKREYSCDTCSCWGSHDADHHDAWKQRTKDYFARKKRGNLAANTTPEPPPTPVETPQPVAGSNLSMLKRMVKFSEE